MTALETADLYELLANLLECVVDARIQLAKSELLIETHRQLQLRGADHETQEAVAYAAIAARMRAAHDVEETP